jgi:peptidoglycan hydrolase-like protein with peptidoglycan-binding domain
VSVVAPRVGPSGRGPAVRLLQRELRAAGYPAPPSGVFDGATARAVLAFRKLSGLARTSEPSAMVFRRLAAGGGRFRVRYPTHGHHVEADLTHQVLALIDRGRVQRIYAISSGKPSTPTVLGHFRVYSKTPGTNSHGMVYSNYFIGGYAIHGYAEVPVYAASHGCLRVPIPDAIPIYRWVRLGDPVDVYYRTPGHRSPKPSPNAGP